MVFNLKGKSALVTGASGGIGSAVARALHNQGAELIINGTRSSELEKLAAELGNRVHVLQGDLADTNSIGFLAEEAEKISDDGIDILINNAGITRDNLLVRLSDQDLMDVINLNLIAGFQLTRKIIRGMMKRKWGRVIGISSVVGITGNAGQTNYAAAKAGMIGFYKSIETGNMRPDLAFAGLFFLTVLGFTIFGFVTMMEKILILMISSFQIIEVMGIIWLDLMIWRDCFVK